MSNTDHHDHELVLRGDVTIRPATGEDRRELTRLAQLDSTIVPADPILVGRVDGELRAAYSVSERRGIATPFRRTAELVDLLAVRAQQLGDRGRRRRRSPVPQPPGLRLGLPPVRLGRRTT